VVPEIEAFQVLVYGALAWTFGQIILLGLQSGIYVVHRLLKGHRGAGTPEPSSVASAITRREFLHGALGVAPLIAFGISANGVYGAQTGMLVQRHTLIMTELPPDLQGFKIGQVSDVHLGPYFHLARLDTVIRLLEQEKPDLVAITGDFADDLTLLRPAIERFNDLYPINSAWRLFLHGEP